MKADKLRKIHGSHGSGREPRDERAPQLVPGAVAATRRQIKALKKKLAEAEKAAHG